MFCLPSKGKLWLLAHDYQVWPPDPDRFMNTHFNFGLSFGLAESKIWDMVKVHWPSSLLKRNVFICVMLLYGHICSLLWEPEANMKQDEWRVLTVLQTLLIIRWTKYFVSWGNSQKEEADLRTPKCFYHEVSHISADRKRIWFISQNPEVYKTNVSKQDLSPIGKTTVETADTAGNQNVAEDTLLHNLNTPPFRADDHQVFAKRFIPQSSFQNYTALKFVS